ncbi:MAG: hypothetical protein ACLFS3_03155 [Candidatus Aenigmatarchaeota archaeon]
MNGAVDQVIDVGLLSNVLSLAVFTLVALFVIVLIWVLYRHFSGSKDEEE